MNKRRPAKVLLLLLLLSHFLPTTAYPVPGRRALAFLKHSCARLFFGIERPLSIPEVLRSLTVEIQGSWTNARGGEIKYYIGTLKREIRLLHLGDSPTFPPSIAGYITPNLPREYVAAHFGGSTWKAGLSTTVGDPSHVTGRSIGMLGDFVFELTLKKDTRVLVIDSYETEVVFDDRRAATGVVLIQADGEPTYVPQPLPEPEGLPGR